MKMEKTPRYTQRERNMVLGYAAQHKEIIENKRTDAESNRKKDEVWRQIAKEFNSRVHHQRSSKQLRQLYKNMKLLLKKDLCGEGKGNRSFMDLLNTLAQQESVAQYIAEQMSPNDYDGNGGSRQHKYEDDFDDSKFHSTMGNFDGMDTDVIVIKSEDISDNEHSQNGGGHPDDMDDDDEDCLSPKDMPEVCLEEDDDEIFATDLRNQITIPTQLQQLHQQHQQQQQQQHNQRQQQQRTSSPQQQQQKSQERPEITIQNVGGIRVGSIGSLANLQALQNGANPALSITPAHNNSNNNNNSSINSSSSGSGNNNAQNSSNSSIAGGNNNNNNNSSSGRQLTAEQAQQQLLLSGLGLSAVHANPDPPLPTLHRGSSHHHHHNSSSSNNNNHNSNNSTNHHSSSSALLLNFQHSNNNNNSGNNNNYGISSGHKSFNSAAFGNSFASSNNNNHNSSRNHNNNNNDYLMSLAIEERKRKIDLLNAQIDYWKTLTKKLEQNPQGHNPTPSCLCHFPGKVNGLQTPANSS